MKQPWKPCDEILEAFLATRNESTVKRERSIEPITVTLAREYDAETDRLLRNIRTQVSAHRGQGEGKDQ
jgi:hypothetical protein